MMKQKFLKIFVICFSIFAIIDSGLYIFGDFECIRALLELIGDKSVISVILRWIIIIAAIAVSIFIRRYYESEQKSK